MKKLYGVWFKNCYEPLAMLDIKLTDKTLKPYEPVNTYLLYKALFMGPDLQILEQHLSL